MGNKVSLRFGTSLLSLKQQRAAEQTEDLPQSPEETVEILRLVSQERAQQRTVDAPRPQDKNVFPKRVSESVFEQGGVIKVPETASQDRRLQRGSGADF